MTDTKIQRQILHNKRMSLINDLLFEAISICNDGDPAGEEYLNLGDYDDWNSIPTNKLWAIYGNLDLVLNSVDRERFSQADVNCQKLKIGEILYQKHNNSF